MVTYTNLYESVLLTYEQVINNLPPNTAFPVVYITKGTPIFFWSTKEQMLEDFTSGAYTSVQKNMITYNKSYLDVYWRRGALRTMNKTITSKDGFYSGLLAIPSNTKVRPFENQQFEVTNNIEDTFIWMKMYKEATYIPALNQTIYGYAMWHKDIQERVYDTHTTLYDKNYTSINYFPEYTRLMGTPSTIDSTNC